MLHRGGLNLTAVTVTAENDHTVAFLGTSDGRILKVLVEAEAPGGANEPFPHPHPVLMDRLGVGRCTLLQTALLQSMVLSQ